MTHLHHRLARRGYDGQDHADGEHGQPDGEGRPQHRLAPVPGRLPPLRCPVSVADRDHAPGQVVQAPQDAGYEAGDGQPDAQRPLGPAGVSRTRPDLVADPLQAVRARLHLIRGSVEFAAQEFGKVMPLPAVEPSAGSHHESCSSSARSAAMPRAVWLLTAPRLMFIAFAISASEKSA